MPKSRKIFGTADDTETAFYDALGRADINALMALWADDEEAVCVHPGAGRLIGPAAIRASWEKIFERGPVHIRPIHVHSSQNTMMAVHNVIEEIHRTDGVPQDMYVIATNVYLKTPQGWRIVAHHASVATGKPPPELSKSATLH
jgi:ketosteroid isomerase-like protein